MIARLVPSALRAALLLLAALSLLAVSPDLARADSALVEVQFSALRLRHEGEPMLRPVIRGALSGNVVGPLYVGGYAHLTGQSLPLQAPAPGGGLFVAVRPDLRITRLRPAVELSGGRYRLPIEDRRENPQALEATVWAVGAAASLGIALVDAVALEVRGSYQRFVPADDESRSMRLDRDAFSVGAGVVIRIP